MTQEPPSQPPPPLPQASSKRILPAFLLCFTICAHRIYTGKIISGIVQMGLVAASLIWTYPQIKQATAMLNALNSGPLDDNTLDKIAGMEQAGGGMSTLPTLLLIAAGIWIAADAARLLRGKFTDSKGNKITRWW